MRLPVARVDRADRIYVAAVGIAVQDGGGCTVAVLHHAVAELAGRRGHHPHQKPPASDPAGGMNWK
jgi:hypothetical protein